MYGDLGGIYLLWPDSLPIIPIPSYVEPYFLKIVFVFRAKGLRVSG